MNDQSVLQRMEKWGYYLHSKPHPHSPGYRGLSVAIREAPTEMHFDPESIHLQLRTKDGTTYWTTLELNAPSSGAAHVCPGHVILRDRLDKRADFFVFGGSLLTAMEPGETVYDLHSPAPILELNGGRDSVPNQLAAEVELMIGVFQAQWGIDDQGFAHRLGQIETIQFYIASLNSILLRYERAHALQESYHEFYWTLRQEKEWLEKAGLWPVSLPSLGALLKVD